MFKHFISKSFVVIANIFLFCVANSIQQYISFTRYLHNIFSLRIWYDYPIYSVKKTSYKSPENPCDIQCLNNLVYKSNRIYWDWTFSQQYFVTIFEKSIKTNSTQKKFQFWNGIFIFIFCMWIPFEI